MPRSCARAAVACVLALGLACGGEPRGDCNPDPAPGELGSICGFHNPEDVAHAPRSRLLLVSQMGDRRAVGSIAMLPLDADGAPAGPPRPLWPSARESRRSSHEAGSADCAGPPPDDAFAPHGLAVAPARRHDRTRVAVVHHGESETIELFELLHSGRRAVLRWQGCVELPPDTSGNDVAFADDGGLAVSNYQPARGLRGLYYDVVGGIGGVTGEIWAWHPDTGWRRVPNSSGAMPNGVALSPDAESVFFTRTGTGDLAVRRFASDVGTAAVGSSLVERRVEIGGHPDNLAWSPRGPLLVMTHLQGWRVALCRLGRLPCRAGWALVEVDPDTLTSRERLRHDGAVLGGASSVAEVGDRFYFGAVLDDRIGVWRPAAPDAAR